MTKEKVLIGLETAKDNVIQNNQITSQNMASIIDALIYLVKNEDDINDIMPRIKKVRRCNNDSKRNV